MKWMAWVLIVGLVCACRQKDVAGFSFDEKDYKYVSSSYNYNKVKVGDLFVSVMDTALTLRKLYYRDQKIQAEAFYYHKKQFGPQRLYDPSGNLLVETLSFADFDTTGYVYDKEKQLFQKAVTK